MFGNFFKRSPKSSLDAVSFEVPGYSSRGIINGTPVWETPSGDGLGLYYFALRPDLPHGAPTREDLRAFYKNHLPSDQLRMVDADFIFVDGIPCVWTIIKTPQQPTGMTYLGSVTVPFVEFSFVLKMQCAEHGTTGIREAAVAMKAAHAGVDLTKPGALSGLWNPDAAEYDAFLSDHPLSRLRRDFAALIPAIRLAEQTKNQPRFFKHTSSA